MVKRLMVAYKTLKGVLYITPKYDFFRKQSLTIT
jgi:hypothetical protein